MARSPSASRSPSRSRDNSRNRSRSASRSVSKSPDYRRDRSNSRSRSPRGRFGGGGRHSGSGGGGAQRENPAPSRCLGVFNLSSYTTEKDLRDVFGEFGDIEKCELVYDRPSGHSRGFGFIYYKNIDDAGAAREKLCNTDLDGHKIRVDYSFTKRGHSPTPGQYMGERRGGGDRYHDRGSGRGDRYGGGGRRSPDGRRSNYGGGGDRGYRSGGNGYGDRNGGGGDRRDHRDRRDNGSSSGSHRPYDPTFRRRVASYASGGSGSGGRRRSSERH